MNVPCNTLSVIVPVYNEEKNVINILRGLEKQSLSGFDVIMINDGSLDNTASLIKNYVPSSFRLILVEQKNTGAAQARENGLNLAEGKYVAFVDCDDALAPDSLEVALSPMIRNDDIDISLFDLVNVKDIYDKNPKPFTYYTKNSTVNGNEALVNCISSWGLHGFGIYKKELISGAYNIYYNYNVDRANYVNNDEVISRISFGLANYIHLSPGKYYFIQNSQSTTRKINSEYYKVIYNALYLKKYLISEKDVDGFNYTYEVDKLIISTIWGVFIRYIKWNKHFSKEMKNVWYEAIKKNIYSQSLARSNKDIKLNIKSGMQLFIIRQLIKIL